MTSDETVVDRLPSTVEPIVLDVTDAQRDESTEDAKTIPIADSDLSLGL